jgi:hypothetical protein
MELGSEALALCDEDEPNGKVRRVFLSVLVLRDPPAWVAYWQGDPSSLPDLLSDSDREMLEDARLYPPESTDELSSLGWWDALSVVPLPQETAAIRKAIGDAGEALSLEFERQRLAADGFPELAKRVWWAARESPAYGFDIGSFCGKAFSPATPDSPLAIEV